VTSIAARGARTEHGRAAPSTTEHHAIALAVLAVLAVLAAAVSWVATTNGAGVTADSVNYFSMARQLGAFDALTGVDGSQLTVFPPGYPALLAAGELVGLSTMEAARVVAALSWSIVVLCTAVAVRRRSAQQPWVAVGAAAIVAVAAPLFAVMTMAWSEAPFVAVVMIALVVADRCRARDPLRWSAVALLVGLVWVASMLRYAGVVLVPVGLVALWSERRWRWWFLAGAVTVPALWLLRNRSVDGTFMGRRNPSTTTLADELGALVATVARWLAPNALSGVLVLIALGAVIWAVRTDGSRAPRPDMAVWTTFVAGFLLLAIWSRLSAQIDSMGDRLLAPVVAPLVVLVAVPVAGLLGRSRAREPAGRLLAAAVAGWVLLALLGSLVLVRADHARGGSFLAYRFGDSELVEVVRDLPEGTVVVSNQAEALAHLSGRHTVLDPPASSDYGWTAADPTADRLTATVRCAEVPVVLAWFDRTQPHFIEPEELSASLDVAMLDEVEDGRLMALQLDGPGGEGAATCGR
jgi:hypothetical protein